MSSTFNTLNISISKRLDEITYFKKYFKPSLMWINWLGIIPQSEGSPVRFLVRAHVWVTGLDPVLGVCERQLINVSLLLFLSPFTPHKKKKSKPWLVWLSGLSAGL